jgi:uncharacterized Rossmann fold enzyme
MKSVSVQRPRRRRSGLQLKWGHGEDVQHLGEAGVVVASAHGSQRAMIPRALLRFGGFQDGDIIRR